MTHQPHARDDVERPDSAVHPRREVAVLPGAFALFKELALRPREPDAADALLGTAKLCAAQEERILVALVPFPGPAAATARRARAAIRRCSRARDC